MIQFFNLNSILQINLKRIPNNNLSHDSCKKPFSVNRFGLLINNGFIVSRMNQAQSTVLPFRTRPPFDPFGPSYSRTPFGEPINQLSAAVLVQDPVMWHMEFFLNLGEVGTLYGKDSVLMTLKIRIEMMNIPDRQLSRAVCLQFNDYCRTKRAERKRTWEQSGLETDMAKSYIRDIHRMEANKLWKMERYLRTCEELMVTAIRARRIEKARADFNMIVMLRKKIDEERKQDAERRE